MSIGKPIVISQAPTIVHQTSKRVLLTKTTWDNLNQADNLSENEDNDDITRFGVTGGKISSNINYPRKCQEIVKAAEQEYDARRKFKKTELNQKTRKSRPFFSEAFLSDESAGDTD